MFDLNVGACDFLSITQCFSQNKAIFLKFGVFHVAHWAPVLQVRETNAEAPATVNGILTSLCAYLFGTRASTGN